MTTLTTTETTNWRNLIVTDSDNETWGDLGTLVDSAPANLDNAEIVDGEIASWHGFFISAPGETPGWDTPSVPVDWDGFEAAIAGARG